MYLMFLFKSFHFIMRNMRAAGVLKCGRKRSWNDPGFTAMEMLCQSLPRRFFHATVIVLICYLGFTFRSKLLFTTFGYEHKFVYSRRCERIFLEGHHEADIWHARRCQLHNFTVRDAKRCFAMKRRTSGETHIGFVGDSRIRETFYRVASYLDPEIVPQKLHTNLTLYFNASAVTLDFAYSPYINESHWYDRWIEHDIHYGRPELVVIGMAAWMICYYDRNKPRETALKRFESNLREKALPLMKRLQQEGTRVIWKLEDPVITERMTNAQKRCPLTNQQFDAYNQVALEVLNGTEIAVWKTSRKIGEHWTQQLGDGLHFKTNTTCPDQHVQLLLNYLCSRHVNNNDEGVCCSQESRR